MYLDNIGKRFAFVRAAEALESGELYEEDGSEIRQIKDVRGYFENVRRMDKLFVERIVTQPLKSGISSAIAKDYLEFKKRYSEIAGDNPDVTYRQKLNRILKVLRHLDRTSDYEREDLGDFLSKYHDEIPNTSVWDKLGVKAK
ncbi:MAG: hypothetical protein M1165_01210 [Candidatus Pacearchaeota archaeon]|nr:hypothetical protein [Candidatus Pacearchaeota archaeon]